MMFILATVIPIIPITIIHKAEALELYKTLIRSPLGKRKMLYHIADISGISRKRILNDSLFEDEFSHKYNVTIQVMILIYHHLQIERGYLENARLKYLIKPDF